MSLNLRCQGVDVLEARHIVFASEDFFVVNKPAGLSVQCQPDIPGCIARLKALLDVDQLHPVHRLDKVTSGLLLVARHQGANRQLSQCFQRGQVDKYYYALSAKRPGKKQGTVLGDMSPARNGNWKLLHSRDKPAVTQFFSCAWQGLRLFTLRPHTGKTHQLRVALKSLGAPILGDVRYGAAAADRVYLHAAALGFEYAQQRHEFFAPPAGGEHFDSALREWLTALGHPATRSWPIFKRKLN